MRRFVVLCVIIAAVLGAESSPWSLISNDEWREWKETHGKVYGDAVNESARRSVWETNYELIVRHNSEAEKHGFKLALNQFADQVKCTFSKQS